MWEGTVCSAQAGRFSVRVSGISVASERDWRKRERGNRSCAGRRRGIEGEREARRWGAGTRRREKDACDLLQCQKRPIRVSKETYYSVKRDLPEGGRRTRLQAMPSEMRT